MSKFVTQNIAKEFDQILFNKFFVGLESAMELAG